MLGWRGASRYYDDKYKAGFALECAAVARVREVFGLTNLVVMIPFCRTPGEADRVLEAMADCGLVRGRCGLRCYAMCEIPSNVILADLFLDRLDGFSIGWFWVCVWGCWLFLNTFSLFYKQNRLERPDAAGAGRGPGQRACGANL